MRHSRLPVSDTSPWAREKQVELWRRMSSLEKARAVTGIIRSAQELSLAGVRLRHPGASERECFLRLAMLTLGRRLAVQAYPEASDLPER